MLQDVKLSIECSKPVHFYNRMGGNIPTPAEIIEAATKSFGEA